MFFCRSHILPAAAQAAHLSTTQSRTHIFYTSLEIKTDIFKIFFKSLIINQLMQFFVFENGVI